ncbi:MAG: hypothetical protein GX564_01585 [Oligosphaeraceae bacterium]|nr:hypothetical protein [Oligosphaeraceae bacterium]
MKSAIALLLLLTNFAWTRELYVCAGESGGGDGSPAAPWQSLVEACAALQPGDVLTLLPGEYSQPQLTIKVQGTAEQPIVIQGSHRDLSVLTAWRNVETPWVPVPGQRFVFQTTCAFPVYWVSDLAHTVIMQPAPSLHDMERFRGTWLADREQNILYVHSLDGQMPAPGSIKVTVHSGHLLVLQGAKHLTLRNLSFCGSAHERPRLSAWGAAIRTLNTVSLTIEDCSFYLNSGGVNITNDCLDTVVRRCFFRRNESLGYSEMAQLFFGSRAKNNLAEDNVILDGQTHGLRFYSGAENVTARGNIILNERMGLYYKASRGSRLAERNLVLNCDSFNYSDLSGGRPITDRHNTFAAPSMVYDDNPTNLILDRAMDDPRFCAPEHLDFRLQADSPFLGRGAYPEPAAVYFLSPRGSDNHDGKSDRRPWRTFTAAAERLQPGDTLYLMPGDYPEEIQLTFSGPLSIKGLGQNQAVRLAALTLRDCRQLRLENLQCGKLTLQGCRETDFRLVVAASCKAVHCQALRVKQCEFGTLSWQEVNAAELLFSVFPQDSTFESCAELVRGYNSTAAGLPPGRQAQRTGARQPEPAKVQPSIENITALAITPNSASFTWEIPQINSDQWRVRDAWWTTRPVLSLLEYGETEECRERSVSLGDLFHNCNLKDLKPGTRYYYRVVIPEKMLGLNHLGVAETFAATGMRQDWEGRHASPLQNFVTPARYEAPPRELYVAPDGQGDGSRPEQPLGGLGAASRLVRPGDTLVLLPGTYRETYYGLVSGLPGRPITLKAGQPGTVIFDGSDFLRPGALHLYNCDYYVIDGLIIRNYSNKTFASRAGQEYGQLQAFACRNLTIRNCVFSGFGVYQYLITLKRCSEVLIENNVFADGVNSITGTGNGNLSILRNTFFVPSIYHFTFHNPEAGAKVAVRHNLFLAQSSQKALAKVGRCLIDGEVALDFDANAWYFPPEDTLRYVGLEGQAPPEDCEFPAGLARVRKATGQEKNGRELTEFSFRDHPFINPMDAKKYSREVVKPFSEGKILPTLDYFATTLSDVGAQPLSR